MTRIKRMQQEDESECQSSGRNKNRRQARLPERYDILIQCRDETEQRELFHRLQALGLKLRLLVL